MRSSLSPLCFLFAACTPQAQPNAAVRCPEPAPATDAPTRVPETDAAPHADPNSTAPANAAVAPFAPGMATNCQAPLAVTEEISRVLNVAASHGTKSQACVDGPGVRIAIDELLVCPVGKTATRATFAATYRVSTFVEGDTRGCPAPCERMAPTQRRARLELTFHALRSGWALTDLVEVPGLDTAMTPLADPHDGGCYGRSAPFTSATIKLR